MSQLEIGQLCGAILVQPDGMSVIDLMLPAPVDD